MLVGAVGSLKYDCPRGGGLAQPTCSGPWSSPPACVPGPTDHLSVGKAEPSPKLFAKKHSHQPEGRREEDRRQCAPSRVMLSRSDEHRGEGHAEDASDSTSQEEVCLEVMGRGTSVQGTRLCPSTFGNSVVYQQCRTGQHRPPIPLLWAGPCQLLMQTGASLTADHTVPPKAILRHKSIAEG